MLYVDGKERLLSVVTFRTFVMKQKAFFIIFRTFIEKIKAHFFESESMTLKKKYFKMGSSIKYVRGHYLKKLRQIYFLCYYQSKSHKQRNKIKQLLNKPIKKCRIKTPRRVLGWSLHFLTVRGRWEWIVLVIWLAHFIYFTSIL